MKIISFLRKIFTKDDIQLMRELEGVKLGTPILSIEQNSEFVKLPPSMKKIFATNIDNEEIFVKNKSNDKYIYVGIANNKIYKIAITADVKLFDYYFYKFKRIYGNPNVNNEIYFKWEDDITGLEIFYHSIQVNIILTDKIFFRALS